MDNISQNVNEGGEKEKTGSLFDDIQFEEAFDIEKLQKALQENPEIPEVQETKPEPSALVKKDKNSKKYVIYINSENIDFMEGLSINQRREVINKILKEQNTISIEKREFNKKKKHIINLFLAILTFIICFPLFLTLVNKATEATFINYNQAKQNFSRLYKDGGKIKRID